MGVHAEAADRAPHRPRLLEARPRLGRRRLRRHRHQPALRPARGAARRRPRRPRPSSEVIGIVSLLIWTLILIVTLKYVVLILRADNRGEGGTLSLVALAQRAIGRRTNLLFVLGVAGAALFYGDAAITPAISVLSAVEGLELVAPHFDAWVLPITVVILVGLFWVQSSGTGRVSALFGPVTLVWFLVMARPRAPARRRPPGDLRRPQSRPRRRIPAHATGSARCRSWARCSWRSPAPRRSTPTWAISAAARSAPPGSAGLPGAGAELPRPGQPGAGPPRGRRPTRSSCSRPAWGLLPLVILATCATVIASQAVISGAYSLTQQAVQLGLLPRLEIQHTSESLVGQIYMPRVNWMLLAAVLGSSSSSATPARWPAPTASRSPAPW